ncbi:hypothetical protein VTK26DRAFT_594 [Humicola hyalothermophila]
MYILTARFPSQRSILLPEISQLLSIQPTFPLSTILLRFYPLFQSSHRLPASATPQAQSCRPRGAQPRTHPFEGHRTLRGSFPLRRCCLRLIRWSSSKTRVFRVPVVRGRDSSPRICAHHGDVCGCWVRCRRLACPCSPCVVGGQKTENSNQL